MTENIKPKQSGSADKQETGIKKVSIESIKKNRIERLTPWLQLVLALVAIAVSVYSVHFSVKRAEELAQQNIEQQKISWSLVLLSQLTSNNPGLEKFAATTFAELYKKKTIPDSLLPALQEAAGDPKIGPDAAKILKDLLGNKRFSFPIQLGTNIFNCIFPISLDNKRFFIISSEKGRYFISVIVSDDNVFDFEVVNNMPRGNPLSYVFATQSGTLVACSSKTGDTIYKVDVGSEISLSYLSPSKPQLVKITQDKLMAGGATLVGNSFNTGVGVILFKNGGIGLGGSALGNIPKNIMELYHRVLEGK